MYYILKTIIKCFKKKKKTVRVVDKISVRATRKKDLAAMWG